MNEPLTPTERRALKARAHHLQPVVMISESGLTAQVEREIDAALRAHELIKIRVMGDDRAAREALIAAICEASGALAVQHLGKIIVVYRPRAPGDPPKKKSRPRRKPPRRTKRSYQNT